MERCYTIHLGMQLRRMGSVNNLSSGRLKGGCTLGEARLSVAYHSRAVLPPECVLASMSLMVAERHALHMDST